MAKFAIEDGILKGVRLDEGETEVLLPSSVTEIAPFVFTADTPLTKLTLNAECQIIRNKAFYYCGTLSELVIGEGLEEIEPYAFAGKYGVTKIGILIGVSNSKFFVDNGMLYSAAGTTTTLILGVNSPRIGTSDLGWVPFNRNVSVIGKRAFSFCDKIEELVIPSSVTTLGAYAFSDCSGLSQITLPSSIQGVGYGAFYGCSAATDVKITNAGTTTQSLAGISFAGMPNLLVVHVPMSVKSICTTLGEETFTDGGRRLFFDIPSGSDIINLLNGRKESLDTSITVYYKYGKGSDIHNLLTVSLPVGATFSASMIDAKDKIPEEYELENWYYDEDLTERAYGNDTVSNYYVDSNGEVQARESYSIYAELILHVDFSEVFYTLKTAEPTAERKYGYVTLTGVKDWAKFAETEYTIPDIITDNKTKIDYRVNVLGANMFEGGTLPSTISVPWTVKRIGEGAFKGHTEVKDVEFPTKIAEKPGSADRPSQLTTIDAQAFADTGITEIQIPPTVRKIRKGAFAGSDSIAKVDAGTLEDWLAIEFADSGSNPLGSGADLYLNGAEDALSSITGDNLPDTITAIKPFAFAGCGSLETLDLTGTGVTEIGEEAFTACTNLGGESGMALSLDGVVTIGRAAFSNIGIYYSLTLPTTLRNVGAFAFNGCQKLRVVTLNEGLTYVAESMFSNCPKLEDVTISSTITDIRKSAFAGSGTIVYITGSTRIIKCMRVAFDGTSQCETIEDYAFAKSAIISKTSDDPYEYIALLTLPTALQRIGNYAFEGCLGLYTLTLPHDHVSIGTNAFANCDNLIPNPPEPPPSE